MRRVYLDWNATTPPHPSVLAAMTAARADGWANPASVHAPGRRARSYVEDARDAVGTLLGFDARDVVLTSGGTEANNLAITSAFSTAGGALVVSRVEHPSVLRPAEALEARGVFVAWVEPTPTGEVSLAAVLEAVARAGRHAPVRLVSVQSVNHETGALHPIAGIAAGLAPLGVPLHVDAVQAAGRLPPTAWAGADVVTLAAHKIRGPKGVGAIAAKPGFGVRPLLLGGAQERGLRPGTQDGVACAGFAVAARRARETAATYADLAPLRDRLEAAALGAGGVQRNGGALRAPHVANLSFGGWQGDELSAALDLEGLACSSGAACSAGTAEVSVSVRAMLGAERAASAVRFSLGEETTSEDIEEAAERLSHVLARRSAGT